MPGIPREFAEHSLQLLLGAKPVKQTMRRISGPKRTAVEAEVDRLLAAGFIREIKKSQWVANPVLVEKKHTDILRMWHPLLAQLVRRAVAPCASPRYLAARYDNAT